MTERTFHRSHAVAVMLGLSLFVLAALMPLPVRSAPLSGRGLSPIQKEGVNGYCGYDPRIRVLPSAPTMQDEVQLVFSGQWPNSCPPRSRSHHIGDQLITLELERSDQICLQVITPWQLTLDAGRLLPGPHQAQLIITGPGGLDPDLCAEAKFFVSSDRSLLPIVYHDAHVGEE
jgi:hypothetical protein